MGYGLNISDLARQIAEQAIPQGKGGHSARYDKDAARVLSAAISITLREVVSSRPELQRLLAMADHPIDESRAETFSKHDEYDQHQILHRIRTGMKRLKPL